MTFEIAIVLLIILFAVVMFATEKLSVDVVSILVMCILIISGILGPLEGLAGFSNEATITVAALFIISAAMFRTGIVNIIGEKVTGFFKINFTTGIILTMLSVGILSAFINNTPIVAIFIPVLLSVSKKLDISASKLLMPLSFASMFGGVCTLIGTSTNILVNSIAVSYGLPAFGMFEFSKLGIIFFAVGIVYMLFIGIKIIPNRRGKDDLSSAFMLGDFVTDIRLLENAKSIGFKISESPLIKDLDITILEVIRENKVINIPPANFVLKENDVLKVRGNVEKIKELKDRVGIVINPLDKISDQDFLSEETVLIEAVISPNSRLMGQTLKSSDFRNNYGGIAIAIAHGGRIFHSNLGDTKLRAGDSLLIEIGRKEVYKLTTSRDFVVINEVVKENFKKSKVIPAVVIAAGIIFSATTGLVPIVVAAVTGALLMILTGILSTDEAYRSIDWKVIFLLAGALSMGAALEKTGAAGFISENLISAIGDLGPFAIVAAFYLLTTLLTETMSNNATAVLLTPIAIVTGNAMGIDPRPLILAVAFAASSSFMTPVGYQTNTMIYGAGQYKFFDFVKVGGPLNFIFWLLATLLLPFFFPF